MREHIRKSLSKMRTESGNRTEGATEREPDSIPSVDVDADSARTQQYIHDIVVKYMKTAHLQDGKEVVIDIKHIMSSLGFPSNVWNSKYAEKGRGSLMKADFRCIHKENSCPFRYARWRLTLIINIKMLMK